MQIIIPILHLTGSIVVVILINMAVVIVAMYLVKRNNINLEAKIARSLGVAVHDFYAQDMQQKINNALSEKYSDDLFKNRLSDICGIIRDLWRWSCTIIEVVVISGVLWYMVTDNVEHAIYSWIIVGITIFHWVTSYLFSKACWLFTGSYPGEPKERREFARRGA